jgi:multidrug transporter EmrE-like cation transporter
MKHAYLPLAIILNVAGHAIFKFLASREHSPKWAAVFAIGLALGAINAFCFTASLKYLNMSVAYPIFAGASIALIVAVSAMLFSERLAGIHMVGGAFVVVGILLLTR